MNMVSVMKGLDVRKSRFAALSLDQDSSDEDGEKQWQQVLPTKSKPPPKKGPPTQSGQTQGEEAKGLSKNAKKRARKRRNKSTSSDHDVSLNTKTRKWQPLTQLAQKKGLLLAQSPCVHAEFLCRINKPHNVLLQTDFFLISFMVLVS